MSASMVFNLYAPDSSYFSGSTTPSQLTIPNYQLGVFLSIFSGSYISATSGSYFSEYGISASSTGNSVPDVLYINDNTYLSSGSDVVYTVTIPNYMAGIPIGFYSASIISNITSLSILDFTVMEM